MKALMRAGSELAMMGKVVPVIDNNFALEMTKYILGVLKPDKILMKDFIENTINKYSKNRVEYIVVNTVMDMPCITYLLSSESEDPEERYPKPFSEDYGTGYPSAFCYTFNLDFDYCSEFGDCFFEERADGFYHRVS